MKIILLQFYKHTDLITKIYHTDLPDLDIPSAQQIIYADILNEFGDVVLDNNGITQASDLKLVFSKEI